MTMKGKEKLTFSNLHKYFKGLPTAVFGELFQTLTAMWAEKYGDEEFELDYEILDEQIVKISGWINEGKNYEQIIESLKKQDKTYSKMWTIFNKSVVKHVPLDQRDNVFRVFVNPITKEASIITIEDRQRRDKIAKKKKDSILEIGLKTGIVKVGETIIKLSPVLFSHYCVMVKIATVGAKPLRFDEEDIPQEMVMEAFQFWKNAFRIKYELLTPKEIQEKEKQKVAVKTWSSYVSKINTSFKKSDILPELKKQFQITIDGKRNSYLYSVKAIPTKIKFIN